MNISAANSLLTVSLYNKGPGQTGMTMSLNYGSCITDTVSWKCTNISYPNWNQIEFYDSFWPLAYRQIQNGAIYTVGQLYSFRLIGL